MTSYASLTALYGAVDGPRIGDRLLRNMKGCDCVDNIRYCDIKRPVEVEAYLKQQQSGCCGSVDDVLVANETIYLVGFNHGH